MRNFKVVSLRGGFFAAPLSDGSSEARASERERYRAFKRAVRAGESVTLATDSGEGEEVRVLRADHAPRFGLTESEARGLARRLDAARARNGRARRGGRRRA